jgi:glycosyltransferase involved in cell wall biosynthesis
VPGGAESVFDTLMRGLGERFEPYVVCDSTGSMVERYRESATDLVATPMNAPTHLGASRVIASLIDRWSIDLVHTHLWNADLFGAWAGTRRRRPVVSTVHGSNFLPFGTTGAHRLRRQSLSLAYRAVYRLCDRVIAPSQALADDLTTRIGLRVPRHRIVVVPNGLDVKATRARAATAVLPASVAARMPAPLIVCVANMFAIKGHEWLVRALPDVLARLPNAVVVMVGDGETRAAVEQLTGEIGVRDHVVFTGSLESPLGIVREAHVCVMPSLSEGLPIALLEAMALGRAVVASSVGGIPEVVQDGATGLLVPPADPKALSVALGRVLLDPTLRTTLGEAASAHVEREWSAGRMVDRTAAVYDGVLEARAR